MVSPGFDDSGMRVVTQTRALEQHGVSQNEAVVTGSLVTTAEHLPDHRLF